jgi:cell wall-associated NlpC family hydrolase
VSLNPALGRHRAEPVHARPITALSKAVSSNAGAAGRQAAVIVAASGLVLTAGVPAYAAEPAKREVQATTTLNAVAADIAVTVPANAKLAFQRVAVSATPAPAVEPAAAEPAVAVQSEAVEEISTPTVEAAAAAPAVEVKAEAKASTEASASGVAAGLVASAYSQIGATQDCTVLVEVALRSVGKSVGDLGPEQFYAYGDVVSTPQPGDLVIRPGHVAIYVGNGQVISSGMNGVNETILHPLSDLAGSSFVRVR